MCPFQPLFLSLCFCRQLTLFCVPCSTLFLGLTLLRHAYKVKNEQTPGCELCDGPLMVEHILIKCNYLTLTRNQFYQTPRIQDLFANTDPSSISNIVKGIKVTTSCRLDIITTTCTCFNFNCFYILCI